MNLLQLTIGMCLVGAALLAYSIVRLVAVVRTSIIVRLPAVRDTHPRPLGRPARVSDGSRRAGSKPRLNS